MQRIRRRSSPEVKDTSEEDGASGRVDDEFSGEDKREQCK
jgi:hypothetical protein